MLVNETASSKPRGMLGQAWYATSKAGLLYWSSVACDNARFGIRSTNSISTMKCFIRMALDVFGVTKEISLLRIALNYFD